MTVIVGEEVKTRDGDLICVFLDQAIPPGLSAVETIAAAREQGGLVGIPHPFDRMRGSLLRDASMASLAPLVDWVETHNARVVGHGNEDAAGVRAASTAGRDRGLGRAFDHGESGSPTRPSTAIRRRRPVCSRPSPSAEIVPGSRELLRPALDADRQGRQPDPRQRPRRARGAADSGDRPA